MTNIEKLSRFGHLKYLEKAIANGHIQPAINESFEELINSLNHREIVHLILLDQDAEAAKGFRIGLRLFGYLENLEKYGNSNEDPRYFSTTR